MQKYKNFLMEIIFVSLHLLILQILDQNKPNFLQREDKIVNDR